MSVHTVERSTLDRPTPDRSPLERPVTLARRSITEAARELEHAPASAIVRWALDTFGRRICVTTSFTDTVLAHLVTQVDPDVEVIFLDTGFHFAETLQTMKQAQAQYQLNLSVVRPDPHAPDVWNAGSAACCDARKVQGLSQAMADRDMAAWFSGLRRADSPHRANTPVVDIDSRGYVKVNPIAAWSDQDVADYVAQHNLVVNDLTDQGYPSVGCWPCTEPVDADSDDARSGRWIGSDKTECGLHL